MSFSVFNTLMEERKVEKQNIEHRNKDGVVYLLQCIYDNPRADMVDFSRFSLNDIEDAMICLESGYNHVDDCFEFDDDHEMGMARNYSDLEYHLSMMFKTIASKRRRSIRKFV